MREEKTPVTEGGHSPGSCSVRHKDTADRESHASAGARDTCPAPGLPAAAQAPPAWGVARSAVSGQDSRTRGSLSCQAIGCLWAGASERMPLGLWGAHMGPPKRHVRILIPTACEQDLIWKRLFADVIKHLEMKPCWTVQAKIQTRKGKARELTGEMCVVRKEDIARDSLCCSGGSRPHQQPGRSGRPHGEEEGVSRKCGCECGCLCLSRAGCVSHVEPDGDGIHPHLSNEVTEEAMNPGKLKCWHLLGRNARVSCSCSLAREGQYTAPTRRTLKEPKEDDI